LPATEAPKQGLRELKKARTRAEIQRQALLLFQRQGYAATTIEQIAAAAEVSQSTFFRYFPAKEDVVLYDDYDPILMAALVRQPAELSPIAAIRRTLREVYAQIPQDRIELEIQRGRLINSEPELRARAQQAAIDTADLLAEAVAERVGRDSHDFEVRNLVGAVIGTMLMAWAPVADTGTGEIDIVGTMDAALAHLEAGLPL
jgi:AcrR family transcriptional regulator